MPITIPMPYGIPVPEDLDFMEEIPTWPAQWDNNEPVSSYYYVDSTHPNVQKVHNGTPEEPLDRIPSVLGPGTLCVVRNLYNKDAAGKTTITVNGTDGEWLAGYNGKAFVDFGRGADRAQAFFDVLIVGKYGILDGLTNYPTRTVGWTIGSTTEISTLDAHHIAVRNFEYVGDGISQGGAVGIKGGASLSSSNGSYYIVVYKCYISNYGNIDYGIGEDIDANGINVSGKSSYIWILDNEITYTSGAGIQLQPAKSTDVTTHIYIGKNRIHDIAQAGIAMKYPSNVIVSQNSIARCRDKDNTPSKGIGVQYGPINIWLLFNEIIDCRFGIRGAGTNSTGTPEGGWPYYAIGNIVNGSSIDRFEQAYTYQPDNPYNSVSAFNSTGYYDFYIANNLVLNSDCFFTGNAASESYLVENNIIMPTKYDTFHFGNSTYSIVTRNNAFSEGEVSIRMTGDNYRRTLNTVEQLPSVYNNVEYDFSNLTGKESSFIYDEISKEEFFVDAGNNLPAKVYSKFFDTFGVELNRGFYSKKLPQGLSRDIGPWESGDELVPSLPDKVQDLHISSSSLELRWSLTSINETSIEVYKDGVIFSTLPPKTDSLYVPDILEGVNEYSVRLINDTGVSYSDLIYSKDMAFYPTEDSMILDEATAYLICREDQRLDTLDFSMPMPTASRTFSGTPFNKCVTLNGGDEVGNGYIYLSDLDLDDFIKIRFDHPNIDVNISLVFSNSSLNDEGGVKNYEFLIYIEDTIYTVDFSQGFMKHVVGFTVPADGCEVLIVPKGVYTKGMMGVGSIYTTSLASELPDAPDPDKTDFTYSISSNGTDVTFTNPTGVATGTWDFGDGTTSTDVNPTHSYVKGNYTVSFTGANSQQIIVNPVAVVDPNFTYSIEDNVISFFSDGTTGTWDFGDGTTSTDVNPVKTFPVGNYGISLANGPKTWINIYNDPKYTPSGEVTERIIALGDSITAAGDVTQSESYRRADEYMSAWYRGPWASASLVIAEGDYLVEDNLGKSGYKTYQVLEGNPLQEAIYSNATLVMIMLGINDITQGYTMAEAKSNYKGIVDALLATNKKVLIIPVAYANLDGEDVTAQNIMVDELNAYLATLVTSDNKVKMSAVNQEYDNLIIQDYTLVSRDRLHPNDRGGMLLGEGPALTLNEFYPSSIKKDSKIIGFEGSSGSANKEGSMPTGWSSLYGKLWEPEVLYKGNEWLRVTTNSVEGDTIGNKTRISLVTKPTGLEEGWYVLEFKAEFVNASGLNHLRIVAESTSSYGLSQLTTLSPYASDSFKDGVEYKLRTLKMRVGSSDGISYIYIDTSQFTNGQDVTMYFRDPMFYKIADL